MSRYYRRRPRWWPEDEPWPPTGPPRWARRTRGVPPTWRLFMLVPVLLGAVGVANIAIALAGFLLLSRAVAVLLAVTTLLLLFGVVGAGFAFALRAARHRTRSGEEQRRRRVAEMAHELRTPLAVIRGEAEAIADGVHPADAEHLGRIRDAASAIESLVEDLGSLADAEAGPMPVRPGPVEPGEVLEAAVDALGETARAADVELKVEVQAGLPTVEWDASRVRRAVQNLLANAIRHSPPGSTVTLSAIRDAAGITIAVADEGRGFAADVLPRAFERGVKDPASPGSGLGLAIAREIAHAHGGHVAAENAGAGAAVRIWLPVQAVRTGSGSSSTP